MKTEMFVLPAVFVNQILFFYDYKGLSLLSTHFLLLLDIMSLAKRLYDVFLLIKRYDLQRRHTKGY